MKIYLCGPINNQTDTQCKGWREQAKLLLAGIETIDPMRRDYRGLEDGNYQEIVEQDLTDIAACDIMLAMAERPSWGTGMEIYWAYTHQKRIVIVCGDRVSPWLRYHSHAVFHSLESACESIMQGV